MRHILSILFLLSYASLLFEVEAFIVFENSLRLRSLDFAKNADQICSQKQPCLKMLTLDMPVDTRPKEYRNLKPLACAGTYVVNQNEKYSAFFLGLEKLIIQQKEDGACIAKAILPITVKDEMEPALLASIKSEDQRLGIYQSWTSQVLTDRNGALYDNLDATFRWANKPSARREIYESLRIKATIESPFHGLVDGLKRFADLEIRGLLLEVADKRSEFDITLGAAVLLAKSEYAKNWKLTANNYKALKQASGSNEAQIIKCQMDELIGLSFVTDLPILTPSTVYDMTYIDGLLTPPTTTDKKLTLTAPYFSTPAEQRLWLDEQARMEEESRKLRKQAKIIVPKAMEIKDASTFLRMKISEKRAVLRATGLIDLPRPREGVKALDALLIPLLDEEVAYEVLRRLAETNGDFKMAAEMNDFESRKPFIARQINEANKRGDTALARQLCDELNSLSVLKFDPTNGERQQGGNGGQQQEWDVEEWYWEQRKRVYGIIAA